MSEFSMMTEGIPWPIAYGGFLAAMVLFGWCTYQLVRYIERKPPAPVVKRARET